MGGCCSQPAPVIAQEIETQIQNQNKETKKESTNTAKSDTEDEPLVDEQSATSVDFSAVIGELQKENNRLKEENGSNQERLQQQINKLKEHNSDQTNDFNKEIDLLQKQLGTLRDKLKETYKTKQNENTQKSENNDGDDDDKKEEEQDMNAVKLQHESELLEMHKEIDKLRADARALKEEKTKQSLVIDENQGKYENELKKMKQEIHELNLENANVAKPTYFLKLKEKNKKEISDKNKEIAQLKKDIVIQKEKYESEKKENHENEMIAKQKTINELTKQTESLKETMKKVHNQKYLDKEEFKKELNLIRNKDPEFINSLYKERETLKMELQKTKKRFKETELKYKQQVQQNERGRARMTVKAAELADLEKKSEQELRKLIERVQSDNHNLDEHLHEMEMDMERHEKEYKNQIIGLNNTITNLKSKTAKSKPNSAHEKRPSGGLHLPHLFGGGSNKKGSHSGANSRSSLIGKLGVALHITHENKADPPDAARVAKAETLNAHEPDVKSSLVAAFAAKKQKESGQGSILDDTHSLLGMLNTYTKYEKMKKMGIPMSGIKNKMALDGFTPAQVAKFAGEPPPPLLNGVDLTKHDLKKYNKMKKMKLPDGAIRNKMKIDGIEAKVIATYFGEKFEEESKEDSGGGKPMEAPCPKPNMIKYTKMKKVGLPDAAVRNKMKADGIDEYWQRDFYGEAQPIVGGGKRPMSPPGPKPDLAKYAKMKKVSLPEAAIRNKMKKDGLHEYWVRDFWGEPQPMVGGSAKKPMEAPGPKPDLAKYAKMKKVNLPEAAIRNKMKKDGLHEYWVREFWGEPQPMVGGDDDDDDVEQEMKPPSPKPDFTKYEKMKKVGLPPPAMRNKMKKDGIHEYWICSYFGDPLPKVKGKKKKKAKQKKRQVKALHWRKKSDCDWNNTIWALEKGDGDDDNKEEEIIGKSKGKIGKIHISAEFGKMLEQVFTNKKKDKKKGKGGKNNKKTEKEKEKEEIHLIDGKRSFNMVVGLRQFDKAKLDDYKVRNALLKLDDSKLTTEMIESLIKFVPTNEELNELRHFKGNKNRLARGEKFCDVLTCMVDIKLRLTLWDFKMKFGGHVIEVELRSKTVHNTLNMLKTSIPIRIFLQTCLSVGNYMNEGTNRGGAKGIKLESIDRFASMKTSDGSNQTMLQYIMKLIEENHSNSDVFNGFPNDMLKIVKTTKRIEAKTIRDAVVDMKEQLQGIGKKITRANRNLHELQAQFSKRAITVFRMFGALKKKATRHSGRTPQSSKNTNTASSAFKFAVNNNPMQSVHEKPMKFRIIDDDWKGDKNFIHLRKADRVVTDDMKEDDDDNNIFTKKETLIESDSDFDVPMKVISQQQSMLRRKKKKYKKVKIRRMIRVKLKDKKSKTERTLNVIKAQKTLQSDDDNNDNLLNALSKEKSVEIKKRLSSNFVKKDKALLQLSAAAPALKAKQSSSSSRNKPPNDRFETMMTGFHTMATNKVEALEKQYSNLKLFAAEVAVFFGEADDVEWEELFAMFIAFFEHINKAMLENEKYKKKLEKERKAKERALKNKNKKKKKKKGFGLGTKKQEKEPMNILEEIKLRKKIN